MSVLYTSKAENHGGRKGKTKVENSFEFQLGNPGTKGATNPEELFAAGYSSCFGSALEAVAKKDGVELKDATVQAEVALNEEGGAYSISAKLNVSASGIDDKKLQDLVNKAHQICPYSKATRGNIEVILAVNNQNLKQAA